MSDEKQIEELAKFCCFPCDFDYYGGCVEGVNPCKCSIAIETAKKIYAQGYRKQSEGEWERYGHKWRCTNCKTKVNLDGTPMQNGLYYCNACGAKMKGGEE